MSFESSTTSIWSYIYTQRLATQNSVCVLFRTIAPPESRYGTFHASLAFCTIPIAEGMRLSVRKRIMGRWYRRGTLRLDRPRCRKDGRPFCFIEYAEFKDENGQVVETVNESIVSCGKISWSAWPNQRVCAKFGPGEKTRSANAECNTDYCSMYWMLSFVSSAPKDPECSAYKRCCGWASNRYNKLSNQQDQAFYFCLFCYPPC